jgi:hypothetical protein
MANDEEIYKIIAQTQGQVDVERLSAAITKQENAIRLLTAEFPDPTGLQVLKCRVSGQRPSCHPSSYQGRGCENGRWTEDPASSS